MEELEELRKKTRRLQKIINIFSVMASAMVIIIYVGNFIFVFKESHASQQTSNQGGLFFEKFAVLNNSFTDSNIIFFIFLLIFGSMFIFISIILFFQMRYRKLYNEYLSKYKSVIVSDGIKEAFAKMNVENLSIDYDIGIPIETIKESKMMQIGNHYESSDLYSGTYKDVDFECSDVLIQEISSDSDGGTYTTTYFMGQWYVIEFNKEFQGEFQVCEKKFRFSDLLSIENIEQVKVEDEEFNKLFYIFSTNAHSVFYVLTPHIIEAIKEINNTIEGDLIFCFFNSKLHIGVLNYNDNFTSTFSVARKIDIEQEKEKIKKEVSPVIKFIDELRLDKKIFK